MYYEFSKVQNLYKPDIGIFAFIDEDFGRTFGFESALNRTPAKSVEEVMERPPFRSSYREITVPNAPDFAILTYGGDHISRQFFYYGANQEAIFDPDTCAN